MGLHLLDLPHSLQACKCGHGDMVEILLRLVHAEDDWLCNEACTIDRPTFEVLVGLKYGHGVGMNGFEVDSIIQFVLRLALLSNLKRTKRG